MRGGRLVGLGDIDDVLRTGIDPYVKVLSQTTPIDIIRPEERESGRPLDPGAESRGDQAP
jgi:peptide/nickel transport system ATP-binding protein